MKSLSKFGLLTFIVSHLAMLMHLLLSGIELSTLGTLSFVLRAMYCTIFSAYGAWFHVQASESADTQFSLLSQMVGQGQPCTSLITRDCSLSTR